MFRVELQGGLGNQLFILGAGLSGAGKFDIPLVVDARSHTSPGERPLAIEPLMEKLPGDIRLLKGSRSVPERLQRLIRIHSHSPKYFVEKGFGFDARFESVNPQQTLVGYFQSPKYFSQEIAQQLFEGLEKIRQEHNMPLTDQIHVHIRRGDYLSPSANAVHGLASEDYFERAIQRVQKISPKARFKVFTDSPELISEDQLTRWNAELEKGQGTLSPLISLLEMGSGRGLIMSNSSFSWWAAWLISQRNEGSPIIAPRPWMANGASAHDLLLPDWISIGSS